MIAPADSEGEESFDFVVATPDWLQREHGKDSVIVGRHHLIVFGYDYEKIKSTMESMVSSLDGEDWRDLAQQLGRYGRWEFEDYRE